MNYNNNNNNNNEEEIKESEKDIKVSNELYNQYLVHVKKEIDALDNQIIKILGYDDWETRQDLDANTKEMIMNIRKCCKNKILMQFISHWFPLKVEYKQQYKQAASAYLMGWGAFMNEVITNEITK